VTRAALSPRRHHVLRLAANGHTNAQIARELGIHPRTVDRHLAEVYTRLGARDRAHAVAIALAVGELGVHEIFVPDQQREAAA
jgi:DNA-binding CsgD family transcriptional regulator